MLLLAVSCSTGTADGNDSATLAKCLYQEALAAYNREDADSAFSLLLKAEPYVSAEDGKDVAYDYYDLLARLYEQKNLFSLQEQTLRKKLNTALGQKNMPRLATTEFELGVSRFAQCDFDGAVASFNQALSHASPDSALFIARCYLMLSQVYIQTERTDSVENALNQARLTNPDVADEPAYRLAEVYLLYGKGEKTEATTTINAYLPASDIYTKTELLTLLASIHEEEGAYRQALDDLRQIIALNDSSAEIEASNTAARIHGLRHEEQMRMAQITQDRQRMVARARIMALVAVLMAVAAIATWIGVWLSKRARRARLSELKALRLAEDARIGEEEMRSLNQDLQKRYYAHLYAIILPILNAKRTKTGFIDLKEKEWRTIEENTDLVLPQFTRRLRKNHPALADDDVRFCCLVAMQVPNAVIANVYGIAPSSVSVRKQRMKKKLDESIANETLENYLSKYGL